MAQEKEDFLGRWSRLKREQREQPSPEKREVQEKPPQLPPVEQLTHESEFSGFMHPKVEDALRRVALKKLFSDPHFNLPDPYEAYSGDWTVGEPMTEAMVASLEQMKALVKTPPKPPTAEAAEKEIDPDPKPQADEQGKQDVGKQDA
jgi:hypothetical protein